MSQTCPYCFYGSLKIVRVIFDGNIVPALGNLHDLRMGGGEKEECRDDPVTAHHE